MAIRSEILIARDLRFDRQFQFHFYDLDFCRQAEIKGVRMGTGRSPWCMPARAPWALTAGVLHMPSIWRNMAET